MRAAWPGSDQRAAVAGRPVALAVSVLYSVVHYHHGPYLPANDNCQLWMMKDVYRAWMTTLSSQSTQVGIHSGSQPSRIQSKVTTSTVHVSCMS